jgi:hypothetical protein
MCKVLVNYQALYSESTRRFPYRLPISIPLKQGSIPAYDNYYQGNGG